MRALLILSALFIGCHAPEPKPEPNIVVVYPDGGAACQGACARLLELHCSEGGPSPGGASCEATCINAGPLVDAPCVARATTRAAVTACNVDCTQ
jgi:hypothetical protein